MYRVIPTGVFCPKTINNLVFAHTFEDGFGLCNIAYQTRGSTMSRQPTGFPYFRLERAVRLPASERGFKNGALDKDWHGSILIAQVGVDQLLAGLYNRATVKDA
jgi:hypothetical protein